MMAARNSAIEPTNRLLDLRFNSSTGSLLTLFLAVEREFELTCTPE